jgi:hypothetical protein
MGEGRTSNSKDIMLQHHDARTTPTVGPTTAGTPATALVPATWTLEKGKSMGASYVQ